MKISAVKATLFLGLYKFLHPYFPHLFSNLGENQYEGSEQTAVEHWWLPRKSAQAKQNFSQ